MNIFVLHKHPVRAAQMQCDRHVVKMVLESAQMLCTAINVLGGETPYKSAHVNHPCSVWARQSLGNWLWLHDHGMALAMEYTKRYGKTHKSQAVIEEALKASDTVALSDLKRTPFVLCMPDEHKTNDPVESYRRFYIEDKSRFARWDKNTQAPGWWPQGGAK